MGHEFVPWLGQNFVGLSTTSTLKNFQNRTRSRQETQLLKLSNVNYL